MAVLSLRPVRVMISSHDGVFASGLAFFLAGQGMEVLCHAPHDAALLDDAVLAAVDVLLVETEGLETEGWELLQRIRRSAPLIEVVAISAGAGVEEAVQAVRHGAFSVHEYPVSSEQLAQSMIDACARKRRAELRLAQLDGRPQQNLALPHAGGVDQGGEG